MKLTLICVECDNIQNVEPASVLPDGTSIYGSNADFCSLCDGGMIELKT